MTRRALVRKSKTARASEQWEVRWSDGHVVARLPTRARAYSFADLVTVLVPLEAEMQDIRMRLESCETRAKWAEKEARHLVDES
jgi:hypothetical protein